MKKGMLITLSSLPAGDTEIHHHTMIKGPSSPTLPLGVQPTASWEGHLFYGQ